MTTRARIQKIEARLDALEAKAPAALQPNEKPLPRIIPERQVLTGVQREMLDELLQSLRSGQKINAIKNYRGLTGLGLRESKDAVMGVGR